MHRFLRTSAHTTRITSGRSFTCVKSKAPGTRRTAFDNYQHSRPGHLAFTARRWNAGFARLSPAGYSGNDRAPLSWRAAGANSATTSLQRQFKRMAADVNKHLERAKRFLEKNRVEDAIQAYLEVLDEAPQHQEATQALGDLYARIDQADRAAVYYGMLFDLLVDPKDESMALLYAQANLQSGNAVRAVSILEPFAATENDAPFLMTYSEALMGAGQLEKASEVLQKLLREKNEGVTQLFDLAERHVAAGQDQRASSVLELLKRRMFADKRQTDFATMMDGLGAKFPHSQIILEFWAGIHNELNRESQYFEVLIKLFDVYLSSGNVKKAAESLERLVDIDPYDFRNQERMERLRGRVDDAYVNRLSSRMMKAGQATGGHAPRTGAPASSIAPANTEEARQMQALEDLIVQTEIFLQYSLQSKALERLQKIASLFPGEEARNARLSSLYQTANWWPPGAQKPKAQPAAKNEPAPAASSVTEPQPVTITSKTGVYSAETLRDLSKISEINQKIFRQQTPRAMLNTAVNEVGSYLQATRALAVVGAPGRPPEMAAEFCGDGVKPAPGAQVVLLLAQMENAKADELGGLVVQAAEGSILRDLGVETALGVMILDKETQTPAGMLISGHVEHYKLKPNECYFLQSISDQILMSVIHMCFRLLIGGLGF